MAWKEGPLASKLAAHLGDAWDDGVHGDVKSIEVNTNSLGINCIKFEYVDGTVTEHGKVSDTWDSMLATDKFVLDSGEYITCLIAEYGYAVANLKFKTNKRVTKEYGVKKVDDLKHPDDEHFVMISMDKSEKIVGFHGKSGKYYLHQLGVYWSPVQPRRGQVLSESVQSGSQTLN